MPYFPMIVPLIACIAIIAILLRFTSLSRWRNKSYPNHSPPALPVLGHLLQVPKLHPWLTFTEWSKIYGHIIPLKVFGRHLLVLSSIDDVHELFERRSSNYSERAPRRMAYLCGFRNALIFRMYDRDTRKARRMLHAELNKHALRSRAQLCEREVIKFIRRLNTPSPRIGAEGRQLSASVILMIAYGYHTKPNSDAIVSVSLKVMRFLEKVITPNAYIVDALPLLRFVPSWFPRAGFKVEAQRCRALVDEMVNAPYNDSLSRMAQGHIPPCLISKNVEKCNETGESELLMWTAAQLFGGKYILFASITIRSLINIVAAGSHTSTSTIKFFFLAMLLHPHAQKTLQDQVDQVTRGSRLPSLHDRPVLPYVDCVLQEVYRWRPVAPLVAHSCRVDDHYKGQCIRAGTVVMANVWAMAHDADVYPDPHLFRPERFLSSATRDPRTFVFGFGRRICPGLHLAEDLLWLMIATFAATMKVVPALDANGNEVIPDASFTSGAVIEPLPFQCRMVVRSGQAQELLDTYNQN